MTVYIESEGRQFGLEERVRLCQQKGPRPTDEDPILYQVDASTLSFPVTRVRLWAFRHGYGCPKVVA